MAGRMVEQLARAGIGLAGAVALGGSLISFRRQSRVYTTPCLVVSVVVGGLAWLYVLWGTEGCLLSRPTLALAGVGLGLIWWDLWGAGARRDTRVASGLCGAAGLMAYAGFPGVRSAASAGHGFWLGLADALFVCTVSTLAAGWLALASRSQDASHSGAEPVLGRALLWQTLSLFLRGVGAQAVWGTYWSWSPVQCWQLAVWLLIALLALALRRLGLGRRKPWLPVGLALAFSVFVLLGALATSLWLRPDGIVG